MLMILDCWLNRAGRLPSCRSSILKKHTDQRFTFLLKKFGPAVFHTKAFRRNFTDFSYQLLTEFHGIRVDGIPY